MSVSVLRCPQAELRASVLGVRCRSPPRQPSHCGRLAETTTEVERYGRWYDTHLRRWVSCRAARETAGGRDASAETDYKYGQVAAKQCHAMSLSRLRDLGQLKPNHMLQPCGLTRTADTVKVFRSGVPPSALDNPPEVRRQSRCRASCVTGTLLSFPPELVGVQI